MIISWYAVSDKTALGQKIIQIYSQKRLSDWILFQNNLTFFWKKVKWRQT